MTTIQSQSGHAQLFRIVTLDDVDGAFSGVTQQGGRWTSPGASVAYASTSAAGALLEFLAHLEGATPPDLRMVVATVRDELIRPVGELPEGWESRPYRPNVQALGDEWLSSDASLAMEVPSALCNRTSNVLVNTRHQSHGDLSVISCDLIEVDPRLRF